MTQEEVKTKREFGLIFKCRECFYYSPEAKNNCTNKRQKECVDNNFKYFTKNL